MEDLLLNRKNELIDKLGNGGLKELKSSKLLRLIEPQIEDLCKYWTKKQVYNMVNKIFDDNIISASFFYRFSKNLEKETIKKDKKIEVGVSQKKDINGDEDKKSINNIDDLTDSTLDFLSKNLPKK
ncbi:hypothetical protein [Aliarcobacter butzleri]|uniref:hypothetical protein n=1 Tax=Aliarcobacter butzleri TaxID=28197 RepID=UPI002B242EA9|nr:hypothetical protein [Aliarcobacter butzleri]